MIRALGLGIVTLLVFAPLPVAPQPLPCSSPQHRQFDFWIGEWNVRDRSGRLLGVSRVERMPDDCALYESWSGTGGDRGHSVSAYDSSANTWHQTWVDDAGTMVLSGGLINDEMVLEGERRLPDGTETLERATWTPGADGSVRLVWLSSRERGMRWTTAYEAIYHRKR
ncbi:MAG TPA: hypothetical protein VFZ73_09815 [Gemmatimonadaceae bacterium]